MRWMLLPACAAPARADGIALRDGDASLARGAPITRLSGDFPVFFDPGRSLCCEDRRDSRICHGKLRASAGGAWRVWEDGVACGTVFSGATRAALPVS